MKFIFMLQLMLISLIFLYSHHPMNMGFMLIMNTFVFSFMTGSLMKTFWFLYILIIVFIGGMLILFIYVNSLFPNEKFTLNQWFIIIAILLSSILLLISTLMNFKFHLFKPNNNLNSLNLINNTFFLYSMKMFSSYSSLIITALVNYLFFCFIIFVKITNFFSGPLRKINYV